MRYRGEEAIGLIETIGMVPAIYAADAMLKAGDTELVSYENVGSTLVTIIVKGDVAACEAFAGIDSVVQLVAGDNIDIVLTAMVGFSGMLPTTAAVKAGKEAASSIGKLTAANVMKRPVPPIGDVVSVHDVDYN